MKSLPKEEGEEEAMKEMQAEIDEIAAREKEEGENN